MTAQLSRLDGEFAATMIEVEQLYEKFPKQEKIRIQQWSKKLCQVTTNPAWKRNRNTYAEILLEMVYNSNLEEPFNKIPPEGALPIINRANVSAMQFVFVHKKKENPWNGRRFSTPKRQLSGSLDPPKAELTPISATPRGNRLPEQAERSKPVPIEPPVLYEANKAPVMKIAMRGNDEAAGLKARLEIAMKNEEYLRQELLVTRI